MIAQGIQRNPSIANISQRRWLHVLTVATSVSLSAFTALALQDRHGTPSMTGILSKADVILTVVIHFSCLPVVRFNIEQVVDYCEASYLEPGANKREVTSWTALLWGCGVLRRS